MRIEKIAGNILKVTISRADFATRNIDSLHLKVTSRSYRNFINDIIAHAETELGFDIQSGQLMIETRPGRKPGDFVVLVKGVGTPSPAAGNAPSNAPEPYQQDNGSLSIMESFLSGLKKSLDNISDDIPDNRFSSEEDDVPQDSALKGLPFLPGLAAPTQATVNPEDIARTNKEKETVYDHYDVICFEDFENLLAFCKSFNTCIKAATALYTYNDDYFLLIRLTKGSLAAINRLESRAMEFSGLFLPTEIILPLLQERGTLILKRAAVKTLADNF